MKKIFCSILCLLFVFCSALIVKAERITLDSNEIIDTPQATHMEWYISHISGKEKVLKVRYRWIGSNNEPIRFSDTNKSWNTWTCREVPDLNPTENNVDCTDSEAPYECCTGLGTGTCDEEDTCFNDVFGFEIRAQDVGTGIGVGLRTLIWNKMRVEVLTPGNNGTFD